MKLAVFSKKDLPMLFIMLTWLAVLITIVYKTLDTSVFAPERKLPVYCVEETEKKAALTFNCAWDDSGTDELLKILEDNGIKSTFFFVGSFAEKYPQTVRKIYNAGHETGNHSMRHADPTKMRYEDITSDISECSKLLKSLTGAVPKFYRAPSGAYDNKTISAAENLGMTAVQWNVDSIDWKNPTPSAITKRIISKTVPGSIILFHLGKENTLDALPNMIKLLKQDGYSFVSVSELLIKGESYINSSGRQCRKIPVH